MSIMANSAEGFDGGSNREFVKFLNYALRSTTEVQSHLLWPQARGISLSKSLSHSTISASK